ncbi:MAG: hypothetical protein Q8Q28_12380 [Pseudomonadota bacterium]|nr:hypothetical protein [Pseudomonadota bacterium]
MRRGTVVWTRFSPVVHGLLCFALLLAQPFAQAASFADDAAAGVATDASGAAAPKRGGFAPAASPVAAPAAAPAAAAPAAGTRSPAAADALPAASPFAAPGSRAPAVSKPFQPPGLILPRVLGLYPNEFAQGTSYSVSLSGENLNPTLKVDFGAGILVKGAPVLLPGGKLKLSIDVLPFAAGGKRRLKIGTVFAPPSEQLAEFQVVQKVVVSAAKPKANLVKLPIVNLEKIAKGVIILDTPAWRKQTGSQAPLKGPDGKPIGQPTPIYKNLQPTLDDTLLFIWHEQNKGVAERYEIRFFKGSKLLAKRSLQAPTGSGWGSIPYYRPDAALIGELFQQLGGKPAAAGGKTGKFGQAPDTALAAMSLNATKESALPGNYQAALAQADIAWEVAGFRSYAKNGVAKSALVDLPDLLDLPDFPYTPVQLALAGGFAPQTSQSDAAQAGYAQAGYAQAKPELVEMEVEISERWPLYLGAAPTGLACPSAMSAGLSLHNIDATTQNGQLAGASGFTFERFEMQGSLNLGKSSYAAHVDKTQASTPDTQTTVSTGLGGSITLGTPSQVLFTTWSFDNVFVDWGDGTQEPLAATMGGDAGDYERGDAVNLNNSAIKYLHAYAAPGQYTVRLFQLGEDDIQGGGQQVAATATDLGGNQNLLVDTSAASLYNAALAQSGGSQAQAAQAEQEYGKAVANRAYMVFCQPLSIQRRTDPAANGPLKLVDISVEGVTTAADAPKAGAAKSGKVVAKPSLGAKEPTNVAPSPGGGALAKADSATPALEKIQLNFNALTLLGGVPAYSVCDYQLTPYGQLRYTGQGEVRTRWVVDGLALPPDAPRPVGPSQPRPDAMLKNPGNLWGPPLVSSVSLPAQSPVGLAQLGQHNLRVEAEAVVDSVHLFDTVGAALGGDGAAHALLANAAKEGSLPKLGVLAPAKVPVSIGKPGKPGKPGGPGPVMNLLFNELFNDAAPLKLALAGGNYAPVATVALDAPKAYELTTQKYPPRWAVSPLQPYVVLGHDPEQPCTFDFPVADGGGKFKVVGLQSPGGKPKVTRQGDRFSGQGDLIVPIPGGGMQKAPVNFQNWKVAEDAITVLEGQFSISAPGLPELVMPAVKGRFTRLEGVAGKQVDAWLDAALSNSALPEAASATQVARWKGAKATLSPDGDWYADGLAMAEFLVYDSGFRIRPQAVALDLSVKQGAAPGSECGGGNAWRGVALGNSDLLFFNFDMPGAPPKAVLSDWGIDADGLCGKAGSGPESHDWMRGKIGWNGVAAKAWNGIFKATYDDLWVYAPWLDSKLTGAGDPVLLAGKGQGQGGIMLNLTGQPKTLKHGPITLRVDNLAFSKTKLGGGNDPLALPAVSADTCFDFQGEAQVFAKDVCFTGLYFAFDGQAYFQGAYNKTVSLSGKSGKIAQGTVSLKEVKVSTTGGGNQRLGFDFLTDLKISQALPAVPVPVSYRVSEPATAQYNGSGPVTGSFEVKFDSPLVKANIKPVYSGPQDGTSVASNPVLLALADLGYATDAPFVVALGSGDSIVFKGEVDLAQFQMPESIKGHFLLGYHGDTDFWATKFSWPLSTGIVLVPGVLSLYEFGGGLGYHVTRDSLVGTSLDFVEFSPDATPVLNAMALVGTVDGGFIFAARGDLNIKPGGGDAGVDMTYSAWLLTTDHSGMGPISGTLGYGGGTFYGTMGGKWGPPGLDSYVYIEAAPSAIGFSIGGDDWYFRVGNKDNPVTGHVLIVDAGSWFDLSSTGGLRVGARANKRFPDISCDGGTCAYVEGDILIDTGLQLNPTRFDATGNYSVAAKGCLVGACVGLSEAVSAHAAAPNPYVLGFSYTLSGCPIGKLNVSLKVLPSVDPGVSADLCSFGEMGEAIVSGAADAWSAATGLAEDAYDAVTSCFGFC